MNLSKGLLALVNVPQTFSQSCFEPSLRRLIVRIVIVFLFHQRLRLTMSLATRRWDFTMF